MYRWILLLAISALVLFLLFIPEIMPRCSCCKKLKFRPFILIHKAVSVNPGYGGSRSVCRKCCRKYNIEDLKGLDRVMNIKQKLKLESLTKNL